jgi:small subunit ribosomal protein S4
MEKRTEKVDKTARTGASSSHESSGARRSRKTTEYGRQLEEKQNLKRLYGMRERQFSNTFNAALASKDAPGALLLVLLERRLDNVVYRLKLAGSRAQARQMVVHGHVLVNGTKTTSPSYRVQVDDVIAVALTTVTRNAALIEQVVDKRLSSGVKVPDWLESIKQDRSGKVLRLPVRADITQPVDEYLIVELYSK